jgi:hypothetical protein
MARKRVADVLIETLVAAGVKRVYGLVGVRWRLPGPQLPAHTVN